MFCFLFSSSLSLFARMDVAVEMEARVYVSISIYFFIYKKEPWRSARWTRRTENLRKKCKSRSDAKHRSRGDLMRELCTGRGGSGATQKRPAGDNQKAPSLLKEIKQSTILNKDMTKFCTKRDEFIYIFICLFICLFIYCSSTSLKDIKLLDLYNLTNFAHFFSFIFFLCFFCRDFFSRRTFVHQGVKLARWWQYFHKLLVWHLDSQLSRLYCIRYFSKFISLHCLLWTNCQKCGIQRSFG